MWGGESRLWSLVSPMFMCVCVCAHFWGSLLHQTWCACWLSSWHLPTASTHSPACFPLILSFIQWDPGEFLNIVSDSDLWCLKSTYVQSLLGQFSGELAHRKRKWISQLEGEWKHLKENVAPRLGSLTCISYILWQKYLTLWASEVHGSHPCHFTGSCDFRWVSLFSKEG